MKIYNLKDGQFPASEDDQVTVSHKRDALLSGLPDPYGHLFHALDYVDMIVKGYAGMRRNPLKYLRQKFGDKIEWEVYFLKMPTDTEEIWKSKHQDLIPLLGKCDYFWLAEDEAGLILLTATVPSLNEKQVIFGGYERFILDTIIQEESEEKIEMPDGATCELVENAVSALVHFLYEDGLQVRFRSDYEIERWNRSESG